MSHIRLFIAVEIDNDTKKDISRLIADIKKSGPDVKWTGENQMHITLKFLGNLDEDKVHPIKKSLDTVSAKNKSFPLTLSGIGAFPNTKRPRVIWMGVKTGSDNLKKIYHELEEELEKSGIQKEKRPYSPHLTLGRVRSFKNLSAFLPSIINTRLDKPRKIKIDKLILFKSDLGKKGAVHTKISEHILL